MSAVDTRTAAWLSAAEARIVAGYPERTIAALRRVAAQQLWKRRKLTKQLDDMRAAALLTGGAP